MKEEKLLNEFIEIERVKSRAGSGDDIFYELQVQKYIDKQRPLWIEFIKFNNQKVRKIIDNFDSSEWDEMDSYEVWLKAELKERLKL